MLARPKQVNEECSFVAPQHQFLSHCWAVHVQSVHSGGDAALSLLAINGILITINTGQAPSLSLVARRLAMTVSTKVPRRFSSCWSQAVDANGNQPQERSLTDRVLHFPRSGPVPLKRCCTCQMQERQKMCSINRVCRVA